MNTEFPSEPAAPGVTVTFPVHFRRGRSGRKDLRLGSGISPDSIPVPAEGKVPRLARLMALAIHFDELIRTGRVADYAELARLGHVTRARMTQIMNLLNLAPDIQEAILSFQPATVGREPIQERQVRKMAAMSSWIEQRVHWSRITDDRCHH